MAEIRGRWIPIAQAAVEAGVGERSAFRWAKKNLIASRREGNTTLVEVSAVRDYAASSRPTVAAKPPRPPAPTRADDAGGGSGGGSGTGGSLAPNYGALASRVFAALLGGKSAVEVVRDLQISPEQVLALQEQLRKLQETDATGKPSVADRLDALEQLERVRREEVNEGFADVGGDTSRLRKRLEGLERFVAGLPRVVCPSCSCAVQVINTAICQQCDDASRR